MQRVANYKPVGVQQSLDSRGRSEAEQTVDQLLRKAVKLRAQSIHIEPELTSTNIRFRVDGSMRPALSLSKHLHEPIISTIKLAAGLDPESVEPQSGEYTVTIAKIPFTLQVTSLPTLTGERVVLGLHAVGGVKNLETIGYYGPVLAELSRLLAHKRGLLVLAGKRKSGIHKTLSGTLALLEHPALTIAKIDAAESAINSDATKLRLAMQSGPHIISVTDITSPELLEVILEAAQHHLVIATMHATSSSVALGRLHNWAPDVFSLTSHFLGIIFQETAPRLCSACRVPHHLTKLEHKSLDSHKALIDPLLPRYAADLEMPHAQPGAFSQNSQGCKYCDHTGTLGEVALVQVNLATSGLQKMLTGAKLPHGDLATFLAKDAATSLKTDTLMKALLGVVDWKQVG